MFNWLLNTTSIYEIDILQKRTQHRFRPRIIWTPETGQIHVSKGPGENSRNLALKHVVCYVAKIQLVNFSYDRKLQNRETVHPLCPRKHSTDVLRRENVFVLNKNT